MPQTLPGVGAGCLLVFILAVGYYITPALVGGAADQMLNQLAPSMSQTPIANSEADPVTRDVAAQPVERSSLEPRISVSAESAAQSLGIDAGLLRERLPSSVQDTLRSLDLQTTSPQTRSY